MAIQLFDTLTRTMRELAPEAPDKPFGMYCCGPTVYGPAHIGNFRTFLVQDVLRRALEASGLRVNHVRNITDVDDKTIRRSQEEKKTLLDFTQHWTNVFHKDCAALNCLTPTHEPGAVAHIPHQIALIEKLIAGGHAYTSADGSVYFKVSSFSEYGKLSHLDRDALRTQSSNSAGEQNDADEYDRESVADFALWKARKPEDGPNFWESPWGQGRPGWHIECSAMSTHYLGTSFDLHGGGVDLCFPHHENEIAQSECAHHNPPGSPFARHWFHSAHLMVDGRKMAKSLGNMYTLADLQAKGYGPMALRYALISGHYRSPLNFTLHGLDAAQSALRKLEKAVEKLLKAAGLDRAALPGFVRPPGAGFYASPEAPFASAWTRLCDDLNVPGALGEIFTALARVDAAPLAPEAARNDLVGLGGLLYALGVRLFDDAASEAAPAAVPEEIAKLAADRWAAKKARDFKQADTLRVQIEGAGWKVLDRKDGYEVVKL